MTRTLFAALASALTLALASACESPFVPDYQPCPRYVERDLQHTIRLDEPRTVSVFGSFRIVERKDGVEVTSPDSIPATIHWDIGLYSVNSGGDVIDLSQGGAVGVTFESGQAATYLGFASGGRKECTTPGGSCTNFGAFLLTCATLENTPRLQLTDSRGRVANLTEWRVQEGIPVGVTTMPRYVPNGRDYDEPVSEAQPLSIYATFTIDE